MDARQVDAILRERLSGARGVSGSGLPTAADLIDPGLALNGHAFTITANFTYRETRMEKQAVIRLGGDSKRTYMVLELH